jgi:hypothetical protein
VKQDDRFRSRVLDIHTRKALLRQLGVGRSGNEEQLGCGRAFSGTLTFINHVVLRRSWGRKRKNGH